MNDIPVFPDSRPTVRAREYRWAPWAFGAVAVTGGLLLFNSLEMARAGRQHADPASTRTELLPARPLADLTLPPAPRDTMIGVPLATASPVQPRPLVQPAPVRLLPVNADQGVPVGSPLQPAPAWQPPPDSAYSPAPAPTRRGRAGEADWTGAGAAGSRPSQAVARPLADPAFTVVQGTIIPAVLETALDSTRAGPVRAQVSRDVRGFDGSRILVPRGSRLIGEYQADIAPGQARAMVSWVRLIRPDGMTIDLSAPATDALGRAGVPGRVNNHTMRRLGDAFLQTVVNAGSGFSQRAAPTVIVMPGAQQQAVAPMMLTDPSAVQPTLTVAQGARVSVFVSQDLNFSVLDDPS
jgi:type IV secretion system protein VirB10